MSYITRERRRSYDYSVKIKIGSTIGWGWKCTQGQDQALQTISITSAKKKELPFLLQVGINITREYR